MREAEKEYDSWFQAQFVADPQPAVKQPRTRLPAHSDRMVANTADKWKLAMARPCRKKRHRKPEVPVQNCFTTLQTEGKELLHQERHCS